MMTHKKLNALDKLPPHNYLAEEILLGSILLRPQIILQIMPIIDREAFTLEYHRILYKNIIEISLENDNQIDTIMLIEKLDKIYILERTGGINKLLDMIKQSQSFWAAETSQISFKRIVELIQENYSKRLLIQLGYNFIHLGYHNKLKTWHSFDRAAAYFQKVNKKRKPINADSLQDLIGKFLKELTNYTKTVAIKERREKSIDSGFQKLDKIIGKFDYGDLIVIAGRPSMGKTSFAINITDYVLNSLECGVFFFSLEMSKKQILNKILAVNSRIAISKFASKQISFNEWKAIKNTCSQLLLSDFYIDDLSNASIDYIVNKSKTILKYKTNIKLIIIDYLQLIQSKNSHQDSRAQDLASITRTLKILARDLEVPIIVLSQLNRNLESRVNKRPLLSDLRESGCVANITSVNLNFQTKQYIADSELLSRLYLVKLKNFSGKFYKHKNLEPVKRITNSRQYLYDYKIYNQNLVCMTNNHKVLVCKQWYRQDFIQEHANTTKYNKSINKYYLLEISPIIKINASSFDRVYDVHMHEYSNFMANSIILHNSIEQDADIVIMLYREDYYSSNIEYEDEKILDILIAKHRNGPVGSLQLLFNTQYTTFETI